MSDCAFCGGKGLIRVAYESGEPFDVAICDCRSGHPFRVAGESLVRARLSLGPEHQVAYRELFDGESASKPPVESFVAAGKTRKAKL